MILIPLMESFDEWLLALSRLLRGMDSNAAPLAQDSRLWFDGVCALAEKHRLPFAAGLSLARAELTLSEDKPTPSPPRTANRRSSRQQTQQHCVECLARAEQLIRLHFADFRHDYMECEGLCRKAVAIAAAKGLLPPQLSYEGAMAAMNRDELLLPVLTQIVGQIGQWNTRIVLDRAIAQVILDEEGEKGAAYEQVGV